VQLHVGTASVKANLAMLDNTEMTGGQKQFVQLRLAAPLSLVPGERFVVRASVAGAAGTGMTTIGGGQIIGLSNLRLRRKKQWTTDWLAQRRAAVAEPGRWCEQMVRESESPATVAALQKKCWNRAEEISALLEALRGEGRVTQTRGGGWLHLDTVRRQAETVLAAVQKFHAANPQRAGASREELVAELKLNPDLFDAAVERLLADKQLERNGALLAQAGRSSRLPERDQKTCDQMAEKFQRAGWAPPGLDELAAALGEPPQRIAALAKLLAERGVVVRLDEKIWMHRDAIQAGQQAALKLFRRAPSFSTMEFRDALGVSRKYAVPLVDYLDKNRFTVRAGNNRTPGAGAKKLLLEQVQK
jgi:selenocysteine-specific elongation factor